MTINYEAKNFLQSVAWERVNQLIGHEVIRGECGASERALLIIKRAKRGKYMEIPGGPLINWHNSSELASALQSITSLAKQHHCAFIRLRPQLLDTPENRAILVKNGAKIAPMHLAAEHTVILDLTQSEDDLLANMRRQTRYEVRRAGKLGLRVTHDNSEAIFKEFHQVQSATARRQHFIPPDWRTLNAEREAFRDNVQIYVARTVEGEPVAYGLILRDGEEADYYEAASTELNHKLPGAYALQWQVIKDLKKQGVKRYNLWGIAPPGVKNHRYAGVTTFKTGFGGEVVTYVPAHDIIINKLKYAPDYLIETIRKKRRHL